jgi:lipoate-protein ligase A
MGYDEQKPWIMRSIRFAWLEFPLAGPDEQLRRDEELLRAGDGVFRIWEAARECVVLGQAGRPDRDVHVPECRDAGVPIVKRCSGGGAVLLGPGCLSYSLVLPLDWEPKWGEIRYSLAWVMRRMSRSLDVPGLRVEGDCDLVLNHRKVSGNAQRRMQHAILHHGTLLHNFEASRPERFLKAPQREPMYRAGRGHAEFLGNLPLTADQIRERLREAWC